MNKNIPTYLITIVTGYFEYLEILKKPLLQAPTSSSRVSLQRTSTVTVRVAETIV